MVQHLKLSDDKLADQITDYLYKDSNSALMLTADWGAGKTHYLNNIYFPISKGMGFTPIMVSLFGVKSIEDIKDRILAELYPFINNKALKLGGPILKTLIGSTDLTALISKGVLNNIGDNIGNLLSQIKKQQQDSINFNKLFICFDDLERISEAMLSSNQLLGYINSLTENHDAKILLVANQDKITDATFNTIKEKTISSTIKFKQNTSAAFNDIIDSDENKAEHYFEHIRKNQNLIEKFLSQKNSRQLNLRTFKYFLNYYYDIAQFIVSGTGSKELDKKKEVVLERLLKFSLFICIEYKNGKITKNGKKDFELGHDYQIRKYYRSPDQVKTENEELFDFYFEHDDYVYYESIYNYLTGEDVFDREKLVQELKIQYRIQGDKISESYKIFNKLSEVDYLSLSDNEIIFNVKKIRGFALQGEFLYRDYLTVFYFIMRDGNVLNLNEEKFCGDILKILKNKAKNHEYDVHINRYLNPEEESPFYESYIRLKNTIVEINNNNYNQGLIENGLYVEKRLNSDVDGFLKEVIGDLSIPYKKSNISMVRPMKFIRAFQKASNSEKLKFIDLYRIVFNGNKGNYDSQDIKFSKKLLEFIEANLAKRAPRNASGTLLKHLQEEVKAHIKQAVRFGSFTHES